MDSDIPIVNMDQQYIKKEIYESYPLIDIRKCNIAPFTSQIATLRLKRFCLRKMKQFSKCYEMKYFKLYKFKILSGVISIDLKLYFFLIKLLLYIKNL